MVSSKRSMRVGVAWCLVAVAALVAPACGADPSGAGAEQSSVALETISQRLFEDGDLEIEAQDGDPASGFRVLVPAVKGPRSALAEIGTRRALCVAPGERVSIEVEVPPDGVLEFGFAMDRSASEAGSDGMGFEVLIDGRSVWTGSLRPVPRPFLQPWAEQRIPLEPFATRTVRITFATDPGPGADATGDVGGFSAALLKRRIRVPRRYSGPRAPNLLLVLVDTLRADALGDAARAAGRAGVSTPHVDRLCAEGFVFQQAYSTAPWTLPSVASIFTGKHVASHGTTGRFQPRLLDEHETLAERLTLMGVSTYAFVANPLICKEQNFDQGFQGLQQVFDDRSDRLFRAAADWIIENGEHQWFAYVHAMDPHAPYRPPPEVARRLLETYSGPYPEPSSDLLKDLKERSLAGEDPGLSDDDVRYFRALYDAEVTALDASLGALLARLEAAGRLENTLVVLTSDHGEEFYEHGAFLHGHDLCEELVRVPLVFWRPGVLAPGRCDVPVSLVDLRATLCRLLGMDPEKAGTSLFEIAEGAPGSALLMSTSVGEAMTQMDGLRSGRFKVKHRLGADVFECYDLLEDAAERNDLMAGRAPSDLDPEDPIALALEDLSSQLERLQAPSTNLPEVVDPQAHQALRALGYVK